MPTYEYKCECEHHFELVQRITAEAGATCPECGSEECRRQISGGGFHLKGSGFHGTDYPKPISSWSESIERLAPKGTEDGWADLAKAQGMKV